MLSAAVSAQLLKPIPRRMAQIAQIIGGIQLIEFPGSYRPKRRGAYSPSGPGTLAIEDVLGARVFE